MAELDVQAEQISQLKESDNTQWEHITGLEKAIQRLVPVWTTIVLMVMSGVTGSALTFAGMIMKFSSTRT